MLLSPSVDSSLSPASGDVFIDALTQSVQDLRPIIPSLRGSKTWLARDLKGFNKLVLATSFYFVRVDE